MQDRPDSFPESLSGGPPYSEVDISSFLFVIAYRSAG